MKASERDRLTQESHQALLGIPGTEEKGLVGDVKEIKGHLEDHSKRITTVEVLQKERNKPSKKALGGYGAGVLGLAVALWKAFFGN